MYYKCFRIKAETKRNIKVIKREKKNTCDTNVILNKYKKWEEELIFGRGVGQSLKTLCL